MKLYTFDCLPPIYDDCDDIGAVKIKIVSDSEEKCRTFLKENKFIDAQLISVEKVNILN